MGRTVTPGHFDHMPRVNAKDVWKEKHGEDSASMEALLLMRMPWHSLMQPGGTLY